jgi:hypothetical protein
MLTVGVTNRDSNNGPAKLWHCFGVGHWSGSIVVACRDITNGRVGKMYYIVPIIAKAFWRSRIYSRKTIGQPRLAIARVNLEDSGGSTMRKIVYIAVVAYNSRKSKRLSLTGDADGRIKQEESHVAMSGCSRWLCSRNGHTRLFCRTCECIKWTTFQRTSALKSSLSLLVRIHHTNEYFQARDHQQLESGRAPSAAAASSIGRFSCSGIYKCKCSENLFDCD